MNLENKVTVRVKRRFNASPERVFDAWLDPQKAGKFLFATPTAEMVSGGDRSACWRGLDLCRPASR